MKANTDKLYQLLSAVTKAMESERYSLFCPFRMADLPCVVCLVFFLQYSSMLIIMISKFLLWIIICKRRGLHKSKICEL